MSKALRIRNRHTLDRLQGLRPASPKFHECEIDPNKHYFWKCETCGAWWQVDDTGAWHRMNRADRRHLARGRRRKGNINATTQKAHV